MLPFSRALQMYPVNTSGSLMALHILKLAHTNTPTYLLQFLRCRKTACFETVSPAALFRSRTRRLYPYRQMAPCRRGAATLAPSTEVASNCGRLRRHAPCLPRSVLEGQRS